MRQVLIAHQWTGGPDKDWIPWAKKELEVKSFEVVVPAMPNPDRPEIGMWVPAFAKAVGEPRPDDIYIGHSVGCQVILRYLEGLPRGGQVDKIILVAPWFRLTSTDTVTETDKEIARPWLRTPIDFEKVKKHAKEFIAIFSDNDYWVPLEYNRKVLEENLGAKVVIVHNRGHFSGEDGITELPELLEYV